MLTAPTAIVDENQTVRNVWGGPLEECYEITVHDQAAVDDGKEATAEARQVQRSESALLGAAYINDAGGADALTKLARYEKSIEHGLYRAHDELQRLQEKRQSGVNWLCFAKSRLQVPGSNFSRNRYSSYFFSQWVKLKISTYLCPVSQTEPNIVSVCACGYRNGFDGTVRRISTRSRQVIINAQGSITYLLGLSTGATTAKHQ